MFKRCIARSSLYSGVPSRYQRILRHKSSIPESVSKQASSGSNSDKGNSDQKKPESWARFIGVRTGAIAVGYTVGKVYYYYYPKPDDNFSTYELTSREPISSTLSIFTVRPKNGGAVKNAEEIRQAWKSGIWNFQFKQPQLQILRAYTPIPLGRVEDTSELQFLIRRDPRGEVSGYLHRLSSSSEIEMRGPNIEYPLSSSTKNVIFIAGGTGIAPALQVAHIMFSGSDSDLAEQQEQNLHVLWANRYKEDTLHNTNHPNPIINYLNNLVTTHDRDIQVTYFTDEERSFITATAISAALDRVRASSNTNTDVTNTETQIIISGPEGFISYLAGPKIWKDGREQQGPLGGVLVGVLAERERQRGSEKEKIKVWKV